MLEVFRLELLHPVLTHLTLGALPVALFAYGVAAWRRSPQWSFAGDVALGFAAAVTILTASAGLLANETVEWPGGVTRWQRLHIGFGIATTLLLLALATFRLIRRRSIPATGLGTFAAAAFVSAVAVGAGWLGGDVLVFHHGIAVKAAAGGALAPPTGAAKGEPTDLRDAMGRMRAQWAGATTTFAAMVVETPSSRDFRSVERHGESLQDLARWLQEKGASELRAREGEIDRVAGREDHGQEMAGDLAEASAKLAGAARERDLEAISRLLGEIGANCAGCHAHFRWPEGVVSSTHMNVAAKGHAGHEAARDRHGRGSKETAGHEEHDMQRQAGHDDHAKRTARHGEHGKEGADREHAGHDEEAAGHDGMQHGDEHEMPMKHEMETEGVLGLPATREGSGTSWLPDETPMTAIHRKVGPWETMFHANAFGGFTEQGSERGDRQLFSPNWIMLMARQRAGRGGVQLRTMLSFEPWTVGPRGYPLLLQTGETYQGRPLVDRQHPHDLFMEVAGLYTAPVSRNVGIQLYAAPAGEPALGPTAFPHRRSAGTDPLAPLGHHWQDSSHISFGVLTAGVLNRWAKIEGSWFNGREPNERRYDVDLRAPDSYSGRITVNPTAFLSFQTSYGFLESPEALEPDESLHRVTASATYHTPVREGDWATTLVWGRNQHRGTEGSDAFLVESSLDLDGWNTVFGRAEYLTKNAAELVVAPGTEEETFDVGSLAVGYLHEFRNYGSFVPGLGIRGSVNVVPSRLEPAYGTTNPAGAMIFLRVRPSDMKMRSMKH